MLALKEWSSELRVVSSACAGAPCPGIIAVCARIECLQLTESLRWSLVIRLGITANRARSESLKG